MNKVSGNGSGPYRIEIAPNIRSLIIRLHQQAIDEGRGQRFYAAFRNAVEKMKLEPRQFGEPQ